MIRGAAMTILGGCRLSSSSSSSPSPSPSLRRRLHRNRKISSILSDLSPQSTALLLPNSYPSRSGMCRASRAVDLFSSVCPEIVVRDARIEDSWEVAETHCSSFFPSFSFPWNLLLRINRFVGLLSGFSIPPAGCNKTCLVAITGRAIDDNLYIGSEDFKDGFLDRKLSFNQGYVAGILTIDTVADFLPRKGPLQQRRTGIAYISNVAVRETDRRRGIAKRLVKKAEARARSWGCRSIALHCDATNVAAIRLYEEQGYKCIKVPESANWPKPKAHRDVQFNFMMKFLSIPESPGHSENR